MIKTRRLRILLKKKNESGNISIDGKGASRPPKRNSQRRGSGVRITQKNEDGSNQAIPDVAPPQNVKNNFFEKRDNNPANGVFEKRDSNPNIVVIDENKIRQELELKHSEELKTKQLQIQITSQKDQDAKLQELQNMLQKNYDEKIRALEYKNLDLAEENETQKKDILFYREKSDNLGFELNENVNRDNEIKNMKDNINFYSTKAAQYEKDQKETQLERDHYKTELQDTKKHYEIERLGQIGSIEEQRIKENQDREVLDRDVTEYKDKVYLLEKENTTLLDKLKRIEGNINSEENKNKQIEDNFEKEKDRLYVEHEDLNNEYNELNLKYFNQQKDYEELKDKLNEQRESENDRVESLNKALIEKQAEYTELSGKLEISEKKLESQKGEHESTTKIYTRENEANKQRIELLKEELENREKEIEGIRNDNFQLKSNIAGLQLEMSSIPAKEEPTICKDCQDKQIFERSDEKTQLVEKITAQDEKNKELQEKLNEKDDNVDIEEEQGRLTIDNENLLKQLRGYQSQVGDISRMKKNYEQEKNDFKKQNDKLQGKSDKDAATVETLKKEVARLDIETQKMKNEMSNQSKSLNDKSMAQQNQIQELYVKTKENIGECINLFHGKEFKLKPKTIDAFTSVLMK